MVTNNSQRSALPDILKGIAVIRMIVVHLMEVFATAEIYQSQLGKLLVFLAGPPGAPLFMIIMGFFIAKSSKGLQVSIYRGIKLIVWGLLLNIGMNFHLLLKIISGSVHLNPWPYVFGVDILFLAGFSLIIMAICKRIFKDRILIYVLLAVLFALLGQILPDYKGGSEWLKYVFAFFKSSEAWSYFPLFPWATYPVAGYVFYLLNTKYQFHDITARGLVYIAASLFLVLALSFSWGFKIAASAELYYHHSLVFAIWVLTLIAFWVILIHLFTRNNESIKPLGYLKWAGRYVTNFYVFQWLLIGNIGTAIYKTQGSWAILIWFVVITVSTSGLVYLYRIIKAHGKAIRD